MVDESDNVVTGEDDPAGSVRATSGPTPAGCAGVGSSSTARNGGFGASNVPAREQGETLIQVSA